MTVHQTHLKTASSPRALKPGLETAVAHGSALEIYQRRKAPPASAKNF
jgi:hypothetical protein